MLYPSLNVFTKQLLILIRTKIEIISQKIIKWMTFKAYFYVYPINNKHFLSSIKEAIFLLPK